MAEYACMLLVPVPYENGRGIMLERYQSYTVSVIAQNEEEAREIALSTYEGECIGIQPVRHIPNKVEVFNEIYMGGQA
jgi:hypothetical protein